MDRSFLSYYSAELTHLRSLATEFAALHPTVAKNLSLDTVPCADPYVERLLEGVAYLGARTRLKLDREASNHVRKLLEALYPDLAAPAPAVSIATLKPGAQVDSMMSGHTVKRGTRLLANLREGFATRAIYTTAQDVKLWPVRIVGAKYLPDQGALNSAGVSDKVLRGAEAGLRLEIERTSPEPMSELNLDGLDLFLGGRASGAQLYDAIFGRSSAVVARPEGVDVPFRETASAEMIGLSDTEALLPRVRASFEGYRLLREYFLMPERFHYVRLGGLGRVVRETTGNKFSIIILLSGPIPEIRNVGAQDFALFTTPLINLFERECNIVEMSRHRTAHVVHADRTRPRDFEIYRLLRVEDAERSGPQAEIFNLYAMNQRAQTNLVYSTERRPRRPADDEVISGELRTTYSGDDLFISIARPHNAAKAPAVRRLDIRALCTNRDLPILDDSPKLTIEAGDPVDDIQLLRAMRRPRHSLSADLLTSKAGEADLDDITWRWIAQLSLNHLSLAEEGRNAEPLRGLLSLYADRGDPDLARHARSVTKVASSRALERISLNGPPAFAHGTEITLDIDEGALTGSSRLLLSALLAQLFSRHAAINSFVRTKTRLQNEQEEITWPLVVGTRSQI